VLHYIAIIHKERGSIYGVSFPDLPGVTAADLDALQADTEFAAMADKAVVAAIPLSAHVGEAA
jgi:predicted RNase H-like HicB family nuclease